MNRGSEAPLDAVRERARRLFEYLHAVRALKETPARDIRAHALARWWLGELPEHENLQVGPQEDADRWLEVLPSKRISVPDLPAPLEDVRDYIQREDPFTKPELALGEWSEDLEQSEVDRISGLLDEWTAGVWERWAHEARELEKLRKFHTEMYELRLQLQREESVIELVWGQGVLGWDCNGATIFHPILVTPVRIEYVASTGAIQIHREADTSFEIDFLGGLQVRGYDQLVVERNKAEELGVDPWLEAEALASFEDFLRPLSSDGRIESDLPRPAVEGEPVVCPVSVLFVRRRRTMFQRFFEAMQAVLDDETRPVPPALAQMLADASAEALWSEETEDEAGERIMLPLPYNDEQIRVVEQLQRNNGVTVQGPPGTGKTHTIANITSHLVAHGKRVLVTSQKEQPLSVLRDKIPEDIQTLCVSLLGGSGNALSQVGQSAQAIQGHAVGLDRESAKRSIASIDSAIDELSRDIAQTQNDLRDIAMEDKKRFEIAGVEYTTVELAKWIAENEASNSGVPDRVGDIAFPLTEAELARLCELSLKLVGDDRDAKSAVLPDLSSLPTEDEVEQIFKRIADAEDTVESVRSRVDLESVEALGAERFGALVDYARLGRESATEATEHGWLMKVYGEAQIDESVRQEWRQFEGHVGNALSEMDADRARGIAHVTEFGEFDPSSHELELSLAELKRAITEDGKLKLWDMKLKKVQSQVRVDGASLDTVERIEIASAAAAVVRKRRHLSMIWNGRMGRIDGPLLEPDSPDFDVVARHEFGRLARLFACVTSAEQERSTLEEVGLRIDEFAPARFLEIERDLSDAGAVFPRRDAQERLEAIKTTLAQKSEDELARGSEEFVRALDKRDLDGWKRCVVDTQRLVELQPLAQEFDSIVAKLSENAPLWASKLRLSPDVEAETGGFYAAQQAWEWRKADTWLQMITASDADALQSQITELTSRRSKKIAELTTQSAWLRMAESLTESQRQALTGWVQALSKVGKGTGKYASKWRAVARDHMDDAKDAVPVWIMPLYRVVESFDPSAIEPFDVVIIDESSQCDVFSLAVLGIAKKVIVVGDDKQISPQAVGANQAAVHELIEQFISDVPNAELFEVTSSLYDHAKRTFPGVIMLREHFRCVPEIIQFSNDLCYDGDMLPLREASSRDLGGPVKTKFVSDGYREEGTKVNLPELEALVELVTSLSEDPAYDGLTMGVISLLGFDQAQEIETALIRELGEAEYERREMRCGDAYHFQGDERDVMFLSMVAAGDRIGAMTKAADQQRINVAASRAKDQMWLFHSVSDSQLHQDDVRGKLLRYCADPKRSTKVFGDLSELCESQFERDVLRALLAREYRVTPQFRVGGFRIDFVVEGLSGRVAIECDGDAYHGPEQWEDDRRRQEILERLGWRFIRIRGSEFYRNREASMNRTIARLGELGIDAAGSAERPNSTV